jgi:hypothetical protein
LFGHYTEQIRRTQMTTITDDVTPGPEPVRERDDELDARQLTPDADDRDPEEAGYGYGV